MESTCCRTIAYADDVAVAATGKDPGLLSQLLESALRLLRRWCLNCGLDINPAKTDLVLFTKRYKIPPFATPKIGGVALTLSKSAKYLGIILDSKLNWNENTDFRVTKAAKALYCCKGAMGTTWGLSPRNTYWLYNFVIKPTLFYGAAVWWTALERKNHQTRFERIMRSAAILITGVLRTTPSKALFTILNWLPADLQAKRVAMDTAIRLDAIRAWIYRPYGHARILNMTNVGSIMDYTTPEPIFDPRFMSSIPERSYYENGSHISGNTIEIFTDGSKCGDRVGCGIFSEQLNLRLSLRLPNYCSILQAELVAIRVAAIQVQDHGISERDITIFTDSKAAIRTLEGVYTTSRIARECRRSLETISRHSTITLMWIPGHSGYAGNVQADRLAKAGANSAHDIYEIGMSLREAKCAISQRLYSLAGKRWADELTCRETRQVWPYMDARRTGFIMGLPRIHLRNLVAVITGHWPLGLHAQRLGIPYNDYCRSCDDEEEEETTEHLLCHCPGLRRLRQRLFGHPELIDRTCLARCDLGRIHTFVKESGWLRDVCQDT